MAVRQFFTQEMFRNTCLGDSEGCFPSGTICYEFRILMFRNSFLGRHEEIDYHPGTTEGPDLDVISVKVSLNSNSYVP